MSVSVREQLRTDEGFTLIEVLVASVILAIAVVGIALFLTTGQTASAATQLKAEMINAADQQIELLRSEASAAGSFGALAMSSLPPTGSSSTVNSTFADPDKFAVSSGASGCGTYNAYYVIAANYDTASTTSPAAPGGFTSWASCGSASDGEPLQVGSTNGAAPLVTVNASPYPTCSTTAVTTPCTDSIGNGTVTIYTFVTDTYIGCNAGSAANDNVNSQCPSTSATSVTGCQVSNPGTTGAAFVLPACADARRAIVAVALNSGTAATSNVSPMYLSTIIATSTPSASAGGSIGLTLGATL